MDDKIKLKPALNSIKILFDKLSIYFNSWNILPDNVYVDKIEYQDYTKLIMDHINIDPIDIDSLIYMCLQFQTASDWALNRKEETTEKYETVKKSTSSGFAFYRLLELIKREEEDPTTINFRNVTIEYDENGKNEKIQIEIPTELIKCIAKSKYKSILSKKDYEEMHDFANSFFHQYDGYYYRRNAALCIKKYCDVLNFFGNKEESYPSRQMRLIYDLLLKFKIIDSETYLEDTKEKSIRSLMKNQYKTHYKGLGSDYNSYDSATSI